MDCNGHVSCIHYDVEQWYHPARHSTVGINAVDKVGCVLGVGVASDGMEAFAIVGEIVEIDGEGKGASVGEVGMGVPVGAGLTEGFKE